MAGLVRWLIRYRWVSLGVTAAVTIFALERALRLEFDFSFRGFFLVDSQPDEFSASLATQFENLEGAYVVALIQGGPGQEIFQKELLKALVEMSEEIRDIPKIDEVVSLATVQILHSTPMDPMDLMIRGLDDLLRVGVDPREIRGSVLSSPLYVRRLVSPDARTTAIFARLESTHTGIAEREPTIRALRQAVEGHLPAGFGVVLTGFPVAEAEYAQLVWRGFLSAEIVAVVVMSLALSACFRTIVAVVLPLAVVGVSTALTLGLIQVCGYRVTLINASIPLLILVVGVAEVSFFLARYYEELARRCGPVHDTLVRAMACVIPPGAVAAVTTSAGFASLMTGRIGVTRNFGMLVMCAFLITFTVAVAVIPSGLSLLGPPRGRRSQSLLRDRTSRLLEGVAMISVRHKRAVLVGCLVLLALGTGAAFLVRVDQYATRELPAGHQILEAQEAVDQELMGAFRTQVGVRATDGLSVFRPEVLRSIERLEAFLLSVHPGVITAWSLVDVIKVVQRASGNGKPSAPRLHTNEKEARQLLFLGEGVRGAAKFVNAEGTMGKIDVGTSDIGTGSLLEIHERVRRFIQEELREQIGVRFIGDYWAIAQGANSLTRDVLVSTLTSFAVVFLLVGLFLRSLRMTLLSMPANVLPLCVALGLMGAAGFTLRVGTSIILPVALGIAVDSTVHYVARVRQEWRVDRSNEGAVRRALIGTGRGMLFSSAILIAGFLCFLIPEFVVFHHVGIVASAALLIALLADLLLVPSLILWVQPFGKPGVS